jgi:hypothetical protein
LLKTAELSAAWHKREYIRQNAGKGADEVTMQLVLQAKDAGARVWAQADGLYIKHLLSCYCT